MLHPEESLEIDSLRQRYGAGDLRAGDVAEGVLERIRRRGEDHVWLHLLPGEEILAAAKRLDEAGPAGLPLFGIPFAVKDNIDVAGRPTTAACPEYAYIAGETAPAVRHLLESGAILIGKTNLDQFATGLVGVRSPYGVPANPFDSAYIPGGSSSGSAVAVSAGLVSFALGTDTAGSGRVPAAFNNIVGLKPTRGALSTRGVVPACRSLDCVSVFALTAEDAGAVLNAAARFDADDPFSRLGAADAARGKVSAPPATFEFAVPKASQLEFFGNSETPGLFESALGALEKLGGKQREIDFAPLLEAARMLYDGPWLAERLIAVGKFMAENPEAVHPVVHEIIAKAQAISAPDAFRAYYRLKELKREIAPIWNDVQFLVTPTAGTIYTIAEVEKDPVGLNANLGYYTNFLNLLDLCALAVPAGFQGNGMPFGISLTAPAMSDRLLVAQGGGLRRALGGTLGATGIPVSAGTAETAAGPHTTPGARTVIAVVGAHLTGFPLNYQLTDRGARMIQRSKTAPSYKLYALNGSEPALPGMVRVPDGHAIEVELWELPTAEFGGFVAQIPGPLGIGTVELMDGAKVQGFLCEPYAVTDARDISSFGGWRAYLASQSRT